MNIKNIVAFLILLTITLGCGFPETIKRIAEEAEKKNTNSGVTEKTSGGNSSDAGKKDSPFGTSNTAKETENKSEKTEDATSPGDAPATISAKGKTGIPECDEAIEQMFEEIVKETKKQGDLPGADQMIDGFKQMIYEQMRQEIEKSGSDKVKAAEGCRRLREEYEKQKTTAK